jgi:hypothetical protein
LIIRWYDELDAVLSGEFVEALSIALKGSDQDLHRSPFLSARPAGTSTGASGPAQMGRWGGR